MNTKDSKIEEMFKSGVHYGYSKSRRHSSTIPYIFTTKNGVDIINIEKTYDLLEEALKQVENFAATGKNIIFVGTKAEAHQQIAEIALALGMPYVNIRWIGGTLTNYSEIKKRVSKLLDLREQKTNGGFDKYTKKEKLLIDREMKDMSKNFEGLTSITKTPDVMIVIDSKKEDIAVTEAKKMKIPIIALTNTDCNIKKIEHPIVANDSSVSSISFFINEIKEAYNRGLNGKQKENEVAVEKKA